MVSEMRTNIGDVDDRHARKRVDAYGCKTMAFMCRWRLTNELRVDQRRLKQEHLLDIIRKGDSETWQIKQGGAWRVGAHRKNCERGTLLFDAGLSHEIT